MVNEKHYVELKQGVEAWNNWRAKNFYITPNLRGADLIEANLTKVNLSGANLTKVNLSGAKLIEADLSGADLSWADLSGAKLIEADLSGADLSAAKLSGANLTKVNLSGAKLSGAYLFGANLRWANLIQVNLDEVNLIEVNLSGANLRGANLIEVYLRGVDLSGADLSRADLSGADLSQADLSWANLSEANFSRAILANASLDNANFTRANLSAAFLNNVDISGANLKDIDIQEANKYGLEFSRTNLSGANLSNVFLVNANIKYANLSGLDLSGADFTDADLSYSNLSEANLSGAKLIRTQALRTNFTAAKFTGACLEDWNINSATKLNDIDCQYVYLKSDNQERRPSSGDFAPGEFTKLFQKALNTIDLIFRNGVDWEAFAYSFRKIQVENADEELAIQSIENKGDGVVVIRVNVSASVDKPKIHSDFLQGYEFAHKVLEERYKAELSSKDAQMVRYGEDVQRQAEYINKLFDLLNQQQTVQKAMAENPRKVSNNNFYSPQFAGGIVDAEIVNAQQIGGNITNYTQEQKQNLAQAAAEIQQLLFQLSQSHLTTDEAVTEAIHQEIKHNPTLKARLKSALKAGGLEALKAIFNHPLFNIPAETIKGFIEAE